MIFEKSMFFFEKYLFVSVKNIIFGKYFKKDGYVLRKATLRYI